MLVNLFTYLLCSKKLQSVFPVPFVMAVVANDNIDGKQFYICINQYNNNIHAYVICRISVKSPDPWVSINHAPA